MKEIKIKSVILTGLALLSINVNGMAQETKRKIVKETITSEVINVSADSLWAICRNFDKTAEWTSTLNHSYGTGEPTLEGATCSSRTCETNIGKNNKIVEELTLFSDKNQELAYNLIEGAPGFITLANNHWKIVRTGPDQSKIIMTVNIHMKRFSGFFLGRIITNQMKKQVAIVQDELKTYAETGDVSEAKKLQSQNSKKEL